MIKNTQNRNTTDKERIITNKSTHNTQDKNIKKSTKISDILDEERRLVNNKTEETTPIYLQDDNVKKQVEWQRNTGDTVHTSNALQLGIKYGDIFYGKQLRECIQKGNLRKYTILQNYINLSDSNLTCVFTKMIQLGYFSPIEIVPNKTKTSTTYTVLPQDPLTVIKDKNTSNEIKVRLLLKDDVDYNTINTGNVQQFVKKDKFLDNHFYIWNIDKSPYLLLQRTILCALTIMSFLCIQLWPIWLRICVYYISLCLLILLSSALFLHLISKPIFSLLGFPKLYFLPFFLDDNASFYQAITPIIGRWYDFELQQRMIQKNRLNKERNLSEPEIPIYDQNDLSIEWQPNIINVSILISLPIFIASIFGVFNPSNIPSFVTSTNSFFSFLPSLRSPQDVASDDMDMDMDMNMDMNMDTTYNDIKNEEFYDDDIEDIYSNTI